jgi:hypothetical protein
LGINEIDHTIYPYTVGREDCKVLPRSFETLGEAETYLAEQDQGALERGEFYLDGPRRRERSWLSGNQQHTEGITFFRQWQIAVKPPSGAGSCDVR